MQDGGDGGVTRRRISEIDCWEGFMENISALTCQLESADVSRRPDGDRVKSPTPKTASKEKALLKNFNNPSMKFQYFARSARKGEKVGSLLQFLGDTSIGLDDLLEVLPQETSPEPAEPESQRMSHSPREGLHEAADRLESDERQVAANKGGVAAVFEAPSPPASWPSRLPPSPRQALGAGDIIPTPRRVVDRPGDGMCGARAHSKRHQQLRERVEQLLEVTDSDKVLLKPGLCPEIGAANFPGRRVMPRVSLPKGLMESLQGIDARRQRLPLHISARRHRDVRPCGMLKFLLPAEPELSRKDEQRPSTNFRHEFVAENSSTTKPQPGQHPLLCIVDMMREDDWNHGAHLNQQAILSQRLMELRARGGKTAPGATRAEGISGPHDKDKDKGGAAGGASGSGSKRSRRYLKGKPDAGSEQLREFLELIDPRHTGHVSPKVFVPLMFWLGMARHYSAAARMIELAFGPGDIETDTIVRIYTYLDVQLALVHSLRHNSRKESLEPFCEYITDRSKHVEWFSTTARDQDGGADITEVQNLFSRMEATKNALALFRFLRYQLSLCAQTVDAAGRRVSKKPPKVDGRNKSMDFGGSSALRPGSPSEPLKTTFSISDFVQMICRCAFTWCIHEVLGIIDPLAADEVEEIDDADINISDQSMARRFVRLRRRIAVSMLVHPRFWGRDSRLVLADLRDTLGQDDDLSAHEWLSLFNRVRAQGMQSTLPSWEDPVEDMMGSRFLRKKLESCAAMC